jgi:hypothetical protein
VAAVRAVLAVAATALLALAVLWPAIAFPDGDDFPLSPYPMFARDRGATSAIATVVGVTADGATRRLSPQLVNGTREIVQASAVVADEVALGHAERLCAEVAARLAVTGEGGAGRAGAGPRTQIVAVEVVTETYDVVAWSAGRREPTARVVHGACPVGPR